jgi:hypothetical protein
LPFHADISLLLRLDIILLHFLHFLRHYDYFISLRVFFSLLLLLSSLSLRLLQRFCQLLSRRHFDIWRSVSPASASSHFISFAFIYD